jgi:hypothetical protein
MGYLTFVMCACNGLGNKEVMGSCEEQVEADDSEEEVEVNDNEEEVEVNDSEEEVEVEVEANNSEDYNLIDNTEQEVKDMAYEHDDTLNCRTYA